MPGVPVSAQNEGGGHRSVVESGWYREGEGLRPWSGAGLFCLGDICAGPKRFLMSVGDPIQIRADYNKRTQRASTTSNNALAADWRNIDLLYRAARAGRALGLGRAATMVAGNRECLCAAAVRAAAAAAFLRRCSFARGGCVVRSRRRWCSFWRCLARASCHARRRLQAARPSV